MFCKMRPSESKQMLYFAYGSNLDQEDWRKFCLKHRFPVDCIKSVGPAFLPDSELVFNVFSRTRGGGALNIQRRTGSYVCGAIFEVDEVGWRALDFKEGVEDRVYQRVDCCVLLPSGTSIAAVTYEVTEESRGEYTKPTAAYLKAVCNGLRRFGFSEVSVNQAARGEGLLDGLVGIFVYGTLLPGESRHWILDSFTTLKASIATARGHLHATENEYPILEIDNSRTASNVDGMIFYFEDLSKVIERLDPIEGFTKFCSTYNEYDRTLLTVNGDNGNSSRAWCYVAGDLSIATQKISSGSWLEFKRRLN